MLKTPTRTMPAATAQHFAESTFQFTLATLNCYLIPKLLVNKANKTCANQEDRAKKIGRWISTTPVDLCGLQEVWGSDCYAMEESANNGKNTNLKISNTSTSTSTSGPRATSTGQLQHDQNDPIFFTKNKYSFLYKSWRSTFLDTLKVYFLEKTGGLQVVFDTEKFDLEERYLRKKTYRNSISRSNKGIVACLFKSKKNCFDRHDGLVVPEAGTSTSTATDHSTPHEKNKYVLLFNTHLDHVNLQNSQSKQLQELADFVRETVSEILFCSSTPAGQQGVGVSSERSRNGFNINPESLAIFILGDFNIDGGVAEEVEQKQTRKQRLVTESRHLAKRIREYISSASRTTSSTSSTWGNWLDSFLYPNPEDNGPIAMARYFESVGEDEQERLYGELCRIPLPHRGRGKVSTSSSSSTTPTPTSGTILGGTADETSAASSGLRDLHREFCMTKNQSTSTNDLLCNTFGPSAENSYVPEEYSTRRLDYLFAVDSLELWVPSCCDRTDAEDVAAEEAKVVKSEGAIAARTSKRTIQFLKSQVRALNVVKQEYGHEFSDHWGLQAEVVI
ncbi:unnamed protein product [Amoebophrya sp. A120]|nr:unnamed protein product [Amoebophrya sp. A120]|eukprot:GSA120T00007123001.1